MPYIKFDTPSDANKGSSGGFIAYMEKEDQEKGINKEFWFDEREDYIPSYRIMEDMENQKGLGKNDFRYYTGSISFSEEELAFLNNDCKKLKQFGQAFIKEYAGNFNKGLSSSDVRFYLKLETDRYYKGTDAEVVAGKMKSGDKKPGCNTHFHFIVGRKSTDEKMKLSPLSNHINTKSGAVTGGFSRDVLKERTEYLFDSMFKYNRPLEQTYQHLKNTRPDQAPGKRVRSVSQSIDKNQSFLKYDYLTNEEKEKKLVGLINYMKHGISRDNGAPMEIDKKEVLKEAQKRNYDGDVYKALLNMNYKLKNGPPPSKNLTPYILRYAKFVDAPYSKLPESLKEDRFMRFVQVINRKLPKDDRLDGQKLFDKEKQHNLDGKVYRALGEFKKTMDNDGKVSDSNATVINLVKGRRTISSAYPTKEQDQKQPKEETGKGISSFFESMKGSSIEAESSSEYKEENKPKKKKRKRPKRGL